MHSRINRQVGIQSRQQAHAPGHKVTVPTCEIVKLGEHELGIVFIFRVSQQNTDDNKIAGKVQSQNCFESVCKQRR